MKSDLTLKSEGNKLKTYRKLMGLKQIDTAMILKTEQGNYCRMEQGRLNCGDRLSKLRTLFESWRVTEISRIKDHLKYLESL